jgi:hypothetical protein
LDLESLRIEEEMSLRAYNVCVNNKLLSLADLLDYYTANKTFRKLNRCGRKSEIELVEICLKHIPLKSTAINLTHTGEAEMPMTFKRLREHELKWQYFYTEGYARFVRLSTRAQNSIRKLTEYVGFDIEKFIIMTILNPCDFQKIKDTGKKTVIELNRFKNNLRKLMIDLDSREFNELDLLITELERTLGLKLKKDKNLIKALESRQLNLVQFLDNYILKSDLCSARDKALLRYIIQIGRDIKDKTFFDPVAKKFKMTNERVRQLRKEFDKEIPLKFDFLPKLFEYSYDLHSNIFDRKYWIISAQPLNINLPERIENSPNSLGNLLKYFEGQKYYSLTRSLKLKAFNSPFDTDKYKRHRRFEVPCIIHHDFISQNKMVEILNTVYSKIYGKIKKDCLYTFDEFKLNNEQQKFVADIVSRNFQLQQSTEGGVFLKRNTLVTAPEIIESILRERNDLMSAEEVHAAYNHRYPEKNKPLNSVISALHGDRFIYLKGRLKRYGLKEWGSSKEK